MKSRKSFIVTFAVTMVAFALGAGVGEASSDVDSTFVGKVSQGGAYEVEASKFAKLHASAQDVKDLATAEVHDHELVNKALKKLADAAGIAVSSDTQRGIPTAAQHFALNCRRWIRCSLYRGHETNS